MPLMPSSLCALKQQEGLKGVTEVLWVGRSLSILKLPEQLLQLTLQSMIKQ